MDGILSGRYGWRRTVEGTAALRLDINSLTSALRQGSDQATITWRSHEVPIAEARVMLFLENWAGHAQIDFWTTRRAGRMARQAQTISLEASPCRFGGKRWWWVCPAIGGRCCLLMLPKGGDRFLSRAGWQLAYACQAETALSRCHRRLRKLAMRMGGDVGAFPASLPPARPKWMHHGTYARLVEAWWAEQAQLETLCALNLPQALGATLKAKH